jgi:hypothetical protein
LLRDRRNPTLTKSALEDKQMVAWSHPKKMNCSCSSCFILSSSRKHGRSPISGSVRTVASNETSMVKVGFKERRQQQRIIHLVVDHNQQSRSCRSFHKSYCARMQLSTMAKFMAPSQ